VFFYAGFKISKYSKGKMTKGEAAMMMSDVPDYCMDMMKVYAKDGEQKNLQRKN